jgi:hypothetical protein
MVKKKLTREQLNYLRGQPSHKKKRLLKDPCWPSTESPECVKLMIKDNPWMLEKGGDKYVEKVVGKKSLLNKEIKKKKTKKHKGGKYKQDFEKNEGYFGKIMNEKTGKLNSEEICHNCSPSAYGKGARKFCKIHGKTWNPKTNSCVKGKKNKKSKKNQNGGSHELRFATLMGQSISLYVEKGERVEEIKDKLSKQLFNGDIPPKYIRLIYRGIEFDGDKIIDEYYKLGKETKPIQVVINSKDMDKDRVTAMRKLELAKAMKWGETSNKPERLDQLSEDILKSIVKSGNSKKKKSKRKKDKKSSKKQKGGALCLPCVSPILTGLGVFGAGAAATGVIASGAKGISMTKSKMSSSNGKIMREQHFDKSLSKTHSKNSKKKKKTKKANDKLKFYIKQENNVVTFKKNDEKLQKKIFNKSKNMKENIKKATDFYDKKIHYCVVKGYRKC